MSKQEEHVQQPTVKSKFSWTHEMSHEMLVNATGLGFNEFGELHMSNDWWDQLIKACPDASKVRQYPLRDIPLLDNLYSKVTISVSEGWQHHDGPSQLSQDTELEEEELEEISSPIRRPEENPKTHQTHVFGKSKEKPTKPRSSWKRPNLDHWDRITSTLENQERFWSASQKTFDSFNPFSSALCTEELLKMSRLDHDGELYWTALEYLAGNENSHQIFLTLPNEEEKIKYLERVTGKKN
ncbi:unnamed protein product [Arabis nemorensis]|uniref:Myb/SANT-like domain-containing protein n=1 Tax=Arabis nemorensis TaxID=586526 RepID=A0A565BAX7_9BRAS|nr:unnamed protein product [Arabis nemorensis]